MTLKIRMATIEDAEACNEFHNNIYGTSRTIEQWKWTFVNDNLPGSELFYCIAEDEGVIKGTQAMILIQMIDGNGIYLTAKSEETLVSQDFRGKGLFEKMYDQVLSLAAEKNIEIIWGFTTAEKAFKKVGFNIPLHTSQLFRPCRLKVVGTLLPSSGKTSYGVWQKIKKYIYYTAAILILVFAWSKRNFSKFYVQREENILLRDLDGPHSGLTKLSNAFIAQWGGATIYRDEKYLNWRIFNNPFCRANVIGAFINEDLVGYCCFALDENELGYIVDIFAAELMGLEVDVHNIVYQLLSAATTRLSQMGAVGIRGWNMTNHKFDLVVRKQAKRLGYLSIKKGSSVVFKRLSTSERQKQRADFDNWSVSRIYTEGRSG